MTCHIFFTVHISDVYPADQNNNAPSVDNLKGDDSEDVLKKWKLTGFLKKSPAQKSQSKFWFLNLARILSELLFFGVLVGFFLLFLFGGGMHFICMQGLIIDQCQMVNWLIIAELRNN